MDWYASGYRAGIDRGLHLAADDLHARAEVSAAIAQMLARFPSFDELSDRRGDHDRATAQRQILAGRGIWL